MVKIFTPPPEVKDVISFGASSFVGYINEYEVLKMYKPDDEESRNEINREILIYKIIGYNDSILRFIEANKDGIKLERMINGDVRSYFKTNEVDVPTRLKWCLQLCAGVDYIHSLDIFHCDISCCNTFIDDKNNLKLGDFAGSCVLGMKSLVMEGTRHSLPRKLYIPTVESELFAVGSTMYEIMTGKRPYDDLDDKEVFERYKAGIFPETDHIPYLGGAIINCWRQKYKSAKELFEYIEDTAIIKCQAAIDAITNNCSSIAT